MHLNMAKETKGVRDFQVFSRNPSLSKLIIPTRNKTYAVSKESAPIVDGQTGEVTNTAFMGIRKAVDKEEFIKIFQGQLALIFNLKPAGQKVLSYVMQTLRINDDVIYFSRKACAEFTGFKSTRSVNKGIVDLLENEVIFRRDESNTFFINPSILFNGNRLVLFNEIVQKGTDAEKQQNEAIDNASQLNLI